MPFFTRVWFAWLCFFRVMFDGAFANRVEGVRAELPAAPRAASEKAPAAIAASAAAVAPVTAPTEAAREGALQLLALFQREGRLVDFLEQDIAPFEDAEIGATARVVHDGCRKALKAHAKIAPLRAEEEGAEVTLEAGFDARAVKLTGDVAGKGPWRGTLRHRGWRATELSLPSTVKGHDPHVLCPAEVEL